MAVMPQLSGLLVLIKGLIKEYTINGTCALGGYIMELYHFASAFVVDEKLKINRFEAGLNLNLKKRMSVHQYVSYEGLYDTEVNMESTMKDKNECCNEQRGSKEKGDL